MKQKKLLQKLLLWSSARKLIISVGLSCLVVLLAMGVTDVFGAAPTSDWYVDALAGDDGNDCQSPVTPCRTVGAAVTKATAGDTIHIAAGVYTENLELQSLNLVGAGPDSTILDGGGDDRVLRTLLQVSIVGITVRNGQLTGSGDVFTIGGAGINNSGTLILDSVRVISNTTVGGGGGVFNNGTLILHDAEISANAAEGVGGGLYNWGTATVITATDSLIAGNVANQGGGVYSSAPLSLQRTTLRNNHAALFGGGLVVSGDTADLVAVTVHENQTDGYGGGLLNNSGLLTVTNTTVSENIAQSYTGIANMLAGARTTILNSSIANNRRSSSAGVSAGGIANLNGATIVLKNTIVAGNDTRDCTVSGNWTSEGHNLSSDTTCDFSDPDDRQGVDPQLRPLADYGGGMLTHALLPGSPAIDSADDVACPATDQRGVLRPADGDNDGIATCDIGAFEARSQLLIGDVTVTEGDAGSVSAVFPVTLTPSSTEQVIVSYATIDETASSGSDYEPASGVLTLSPGQSAAEVVVAVNGDTVDEADETFFVTLDAPQTVDLIDGQGVGTIVDDDGLSSLVVGDETVTEGDSGSVDVSFRVTLSPTSTQIVTVDYATADDSAMSGSDYQATGGTLTFSPDEASKTIAVTVNGDEQDEGDSEAFSVKLTNAMNAAIARDRAVGTILDDDTALIRIGSGPQVLEGDTGESAAVFSVELTTPAAFTVTVDYYTSDGVGVGGATAGEDYVAANGTVTFAPGQVTRPVSVMILGDVIPEPDEVFSVRLTNPDPVSLQVQSSLGRILNDDEADESLIFLPVVLKRH